MMRELHIHIQIVLLVISAVDWWLRSSGAGYNDIRDICGVSVDLPWTYWAYPNDDISYTFSFLGGYLVVQKC